MLYTLIDMKTNNEWKNYKLIATGNGEKLESFGGVVLLRPDPQVIWESSFNLHNYRGINAIYKRNNSGGGKWDTRKNVPNNFVVKWRELVFNLKLMGFKHTGVFPEQAANWADIIEIIKNSKREISVLNLFAYTGGATLACMSAGAKVCHVDAAKSMCERAKENVHSSKLDKTKVRYIVDDCVKFVEREIRRGNKYDAIIMDPPSYGRGPKGELWKIEENIFSLVKLTKNVLSQKPLFFLLNSYTTGLQPTVMKNVIDIVFDDINHNTNAYELGLTSDEGIVLPCGCSALAEFN